MAINFENHEIIDFRVVWCLILVRLCFKYEKVIDNINVAQDVEDKTAESVLLFEI